MTEGREASSRVIGVWLASWSPTRLRLAALAVAAAVATGAIVVAEGGLGPIPGAVLYALVSALALVFPAAITVQAIVGLLLVASQLVGQDNVAALILVPAVSGVVATTELLAAVARLNTPLPHPPRDVLARSGFGAVVGGGVFAVVVLVASIPGPSGFVAVALSSGACGVLAMRLMREDA